MVEGRGRQVEYTEELAAKKRKRRRKIEHFNPRKTEDGQRKDLNRRKRRERRD